MPSVASQIRIDLLADAAKFKAEMRSAGQDGMGSFNSEFQKHRKAIEESAADLTQRLKIEAKAWQMAMGSAFVEGGRGIGVGEMEELVNHQMSVVEKAHARWGSLLRREQSYSPWGMSTQISLSRDAALAAAAVGAGSGKIVNSLKDASRDIAAAAGMGGMPGAGMLSGAFGAMTAHPLLTGAALTIGAVANEARERQTLSLGIGHESYALGQGTEDTSRMQALGFDELKLSRFQRSLSEQSPEQMKAFESLHLDPNKLGAEPLKQALGEVAEAFDKLQDPAARANAAIELFGRGGAEMIATLKEVKENEGLIGEHEIVKPEDVAASKAFAHDWKDFTNTLHAPLKEAGDLLMGPIGMGLEMMTFAIEGMLAPLSLLADSWKGLSAGDWSFKNSKLAADAMANSFHRIREDQSHIANADEEEAGRLKRDKIDGKKDEKAEDAKRHADEYRTALKGVNAELEEMDKKLIGLRFGKGTEERDKFRDKLDAVPHMGSEQRQHLLAQYDETRSELDSAEYHDKMQKQYDKFLEKGETPAVKRGRLLKEAGGYFGGMIESDERNGNDQKREADERKFSAVKQKINADYYAEAAKHEEESLHKRHASEYELHVNRLKWIEAEAREHPLDRGLAMRTRAEVNEETASFRKHLGIENPLGDYDTGLAERRDALRRKEITPAEFAQSERDLRRKAIDKMTADEPPETHLLPAMQAASREAYSIIARGNIADPKTVAQEQTNRLLQQHYDQLVAIRENTAHAAGDVLG